MKNPYPINLQTSEEVREKGWQAESRDADGHLISCHAPIEADDPGIAEWIVECTSRGETVTFWPVGAAASPVSNVSGWQSQAREVIKEVLRYNAAFPNLPGDIIERLRRLDRTATTEGSDNG